RAPTHVFQIFFVANGFREVGGFFHGRFRRIERNTSFHDLVGGECSGIGTVHRDGIVAAGNATESESIFRDLSKSGICFQNSVRQFECGPWKRSRSVKRMFTSAIAPELIRDADAGGVAAPCINDLSSHDGMALRLGMDTIALSE